MATRKLNIFDSSQSKFSNKERSNLGGWAVYSTNTSAKRLDNFNFYSTYNPNVPASFRTNSLALFTTNTAASMELHSPWMDAEASTLYMFSVLLFAQFGGFNIVLEAQGNSAAMDAGATVLSSGDAVTVSENIGGKIGLFVSNGSESGEASYQFIKLIVKATNSEGGDIPTERIIWLFDPVCGEYGLNKSGIISRLVYDDFPAFMKLDDTNINDLVKTNQPQLPLFRFTESLCSVLDRIDSEASSYVYVRPNEGTESKSKLVDPATTTASALPWLASVTGTTLVTASSGFTPWLGLESYDGDLDTTQGEWDDWETLPDWFELQTLNPNFFDTVQGYRNQISTGVSGINAGRSDALVAYTRTLLDSASPETEVVVFVHSDFENPFRSKILVNPNVDPDPPGELIADALNVNSSAGSKIRKVSRVYDSGVGSFDMSKVLYPATYSASAAKGLAEMDTSFVDDKDGFARHLLMNEDESASIPEVGGGIGSAHFSTGTQYFYGQQDGSAFDSGSVVTDALASLNLGGLSTGLDVVVELSDVTFPEASLDTAGDGGNTPADWLLREKRLIVCGDDTGSTGNDWALYMVSGTTSGSDSDVRLLFIDGYRTQTANNYAYSSPMDKSSLVKQGTFFVRVSVTSGGVVSFFAQPDDHDEWAAHTLGTSTITGTSVSAGSTATVQVLGHTNLSSSAWAYAPALSCGIKHVKVFAAPISFTDDAVSSSSAIAFIDGKGTTSHAMFGYNNPLLDIDFKELSVYDSTFNSTVTVNGAASDLNTTVNSSPLAENDYRVMAIKSNLDGNGDPTLWYFGAAPSAGDTLAASLTGSATYDVKPYVVDPSTGAETSTVHTIAAAVSGDLTLDTTIQSGFYSGKTLSKIEVWDSTDGSATGTRVSYYLPTTISGSATSGIDDDSITWTLTRNFPASAVAYVPAQSLTKDAIHMYEGSPYFNNPPTIEAYDKFSVAMQVRRFWDDSGVTMDIFRLENASGYGLRVYYDGASIKVDFTDGVDTESVSYTESPAFGEWHVVVVRRDPAAGLVLNVDGVDIQTATINATRTFVDPVNVSSLGQGAGNTFNSRFALSHFAFFDRYLTNAEITLLNSEIS